MGETSVTVNCPTCGEETDLTLLGGTRYSCNKCFTKFRSRPAKLNKHLTKAQKINYARRLRLWVKLRDELWRTTGCALQFCEYPCATCTSSLIKYIVSREPEVARLVHYVKTYDAVFAFRGDYKPDRLAQVYNEEFASHFRFTEQALERRIRRLLKALDYVPSLEQRRAENQRSARAARLAKLPQVLTMDEFDNTVTDSTAFENEEEAKQYAAQTGGVIYTQVDTNPDCEECPKHNTPACEDEPCDNIAYDKGLHLVNRTGRWEVVLEALV